MNIFKEILTVISTLCKAATRFVSVVDSGVGSLEELAQAGANKARKYRILVEINDQDEFDKRIAEINADRAKQGLPPIVINPSDDTQETKSPKADEPKVTPNPTKPETSNPDSAKKNAEDDLL